MTKSFIIIVSVFISLGMINACGNKKNAGVSGEKAHSEDAGHEDGHEHPNTTTLTEGQIKSIGIELGAIEQKELTSSLKANGVLKVPNQNKATVNPVYSGVVNSLYVQPGKLVSKGDVIATVSNPEFIQVQEEYLDAGSKIILAEQNYNRQKELNAGNAGALKNLQAAENELRTLRTRISSLKQRIHLMGVNPGTLSAGKLTTVLSVRSPISGVVSNVLVNIGSFVDATTAVAEIVDNRELHLDLYVYEKDMPKIKDRQLIHFTLTNNPGKEYDAQIFSLGSSFEGDSKAVSVHAKVLGDKTGLIDGMSVTAAISLQKATATAVPTEAIVTSQGQDYIFIQSDEHGKDEHHDVDETDSAKHSSGELNNHNKKPEEEDNLKEKEEGLKFERIPVAKGTTDVGYTEVTLLKKIPKNVKIVVKGAFFVLAKMTNTGEHEH